MQALLTEVLKFFESGEDGSACFGRWLIAPAV
jgi:hypothetical protein